ncbi:tyrosine-type recombinase/integrase [Comamonas aquatica]|uniref:tyrosine-type recombinase/integrase n=1 Tax=Comamonas aquatica TaxID=225991 RepID=UPI0021B0A6D7|nr:integrase arm-type DNA-binding domain-containing protein [Comamonas aquatica]
MPLGDTFVRQAKPSGKPAGDTYADGGGMYLLVKSSGKYWRMDYRFAGKRKTLALGVYPAVTLAQARKRREEAKAQLAEGTDPSITKREDKLAKKAIAGNTFEKVAEQWLKATKADRKEITQHKLQTWLKKDIFPSIGKLPITTIGPRDVLTVARKMEERGARDSAKRLVQICGQVFRYAVAEGSAERDVTQDLKGALQKAEKRHYAAITEPAQLAPLLRAIDGYMGHLYSRTALKLTPLVFVRPGELRTAEWVEIDFDAAEWRIPAAKMKMANDHIVPLSEQAIALLREVQPISGHGKYVFPSIRTGERPMSENTVNAALRALGYDSTMQTAHGFRATARTIMDEVMGERVDLIEHQLAHAVKDANGRAYNRTAHLPARKAMMQRWSDYLEQLKRGAEVIPLQRQG